MKALHFVTVMMILLTISAMAGCGACPVAPGERLVVYIVNDTGADVDAIQLGYALGDQLLGSVVGCYADSSPIKPTDSISFEFLREDFPENADLSQFSLQIQARNTNAAVFSSNIPVSVSAAFGKIYRISLTNNHAQLIP